ncbi:MAG: peptidyl-prolyl cis-trans isomerase, partial [Pseudomonadota bacterium]
AVWGVEDIFSGGIGSNFAKAGERTLSSQELDRQFERDIRRLREDTGEVLTRKEAVERGLLDNVFAREAARTAFLGYAMDLDAIASTDAVLEEINQIDVFKDPTTGAFDNLRYQQILSQNQTNPALFRSELSENLAIDYLRGAAASALRAPFALSRIQASLEGETREIAWFAINEASLPAPEQPAEEELRAFYNERQAAFAQPERRALSLLAFSPADFAHAAAVSDEDVEAFYEALKTQRYSEPETRSWVEFSFRSEADALQAFGLLAGGGQADAVLEAVNVETKSSRLEDLDDALLAEALFRSGALEGAVFGPYDRGATWVVARLTDVTPGDPLPLDDALRAQISAELAQDEARNAYFEAAAGLDDLIGSGFEIDAIADRISAPVMSFAPVDAGGVNEFGQVIGPLTAAGEAFQQAFLLQPGQLTRRLEVGEATYLIEVDDVVGGRTPEFDEIRDQVERAYMLATASDALQTAAQSSQTALQAGTTTLEDEAAKFGAEVRRPGQPLSRVALDPTVPRTALLPVFSAREGDVVIAQGERPDEALIVVLESVSSPSPADIAAAAPAAAGRLAPGLEQDLLAAFEAEIRAAIKVETNDSAFAAYKNQILTQQ